MNKSTMILMEKVQTNAKASKYLSQSRAHAREAESSKAFHALFKGESGEIEKGMSRKHSRLKELHQQASDILLQIHHAHAGSEKQ